MSAAPKVGTTPEEAYALMGMTSDQLRELMGKAWAINNWLNELFASGDDPRFRTAPLPVNETPNPFYGVSKACTLMFSEYYGGPNNILTPIGEWKIGRRSGGSVHRNWVKPAIARLGLVPLWHDGPSRHSDDHGYAPIQDSMGAWGPLWLITKDLDGNAICKPEDVADLRAGKGMTSVTTAYRYADYDVAKEIFEEVRPEGFIAWNEEALPMHP